MDHIGRLLHTAKTRTTGGRDGAAHGRGTPSVFAVSADGADALVELIREATHSCYLGERGKRHDWGHGCGDCPACHLRAEGWRRYREGRG